MTKLEIFDPAMCCSSGVCGPSVDPKLSRLVADIGFLKSHGIEVVRYNLGHEPQAFAENPTILAAMGEEAEHLPIFVVDGAIRAVATYPTRAELAAWFGLEAAVATQKPRLDLRMSPATPEES